MTGQGNTGEKQIRALIVNWANALRAKDVAGVMSVYAPEFIAFDIAPPLQYRLGPYRKGLEEWFTTFQQSIGYEIRDLAVTVDGGLGFSHSLNHITGKRTSGENTDVWIRATACWRKIKGGWKVVHEHSSVPLYMDGSNKAATDLSPELAEAV